MFPFQFKDKSKPVIEKDIFSMWFKVVVACIPGAVVTILFDDFIEAHLHTPIVIAITLIVYGIAFIVIERWNKTRTPKVLTLNDITYKTAFIIGLFQILSIIPGTSPVSYTHLDVYKRQHPDIKKTPGLDMSTGSLGQGISAAVGMALGGKLKNKDYRVYTLVGDGEIDEGQVWEALMFASHRKLDNLCVCLLYTSRCV